MDATSYQIVFPGERPGTIKRSLAEAKRELASYAQLEDYPLYRLERRRGSGPWRPVK